VRDSLFELEFNSGGFTAALGVPTPLCWFDEQGMVDGLNAEIDLMAPAC
jgi:hypothetical protein